MRHYNLSRNDSLARSARPLPTLDEIYRARGEALKADYQAGKLSLKEYGIRLGMLVADYRNEKGNSNV